MKTLFKLITAAGLSLAVGALHAQSIQLTDTIRRGVGDVELLKDATAAQFESLRTENSGLLVFGVDINEAANGSEKARTQGVTVDQAWLEVTNPDGSVTTYTEFWTQTQAYVSDDGAADRTTYFTLLGETGSNRITAANSTQGAFDSTLTFNVTGSLADSTAIMLRVRLLDTNTRLGDPEAFYDFTAGFEDLAVLNSADARYLDETLPQETVFRAEAPAMELSPQGESTQAAVLAGSGTPAQDMTVASWVYQPSQNGFYIVAYEDLYPNAGDYDFNDLVIAYQYRAGLNSAGETVVVDGNAYMLARGAAFSHDWRLELSIPGASAATLSCQTLLVDQTGDSCQISTSGDMVNWQAFHDSSVIFPGSFVNTTNGAAFQAGPKSSFTVRLPAPVQSAPSGLGNPIMFVRTTEQTVDVQTRDSRGFPFALILPPSFNPPLERIDLGEAYPFYAEHISTNGNSRKDWYLSPSVNRIFRINESAWAW